MLAIIIPHIQDKQNGIRPGFGATINIINGGVECNTRDGKESRQAANRIEYYKQFAWYLYVDYEQEELGCAKQKQFSAGQQQHSFNFIMKYLTFIQVVN